MQVYSLFFMFAVLGEAYQVLNDPLHLLKKKKKKKNPLIEMIKICIFRYDFMFALMEKFVIHITIKVE